MSERGACPMCDGGELVRREGRLDQSGDTYLPTTVESCPICGYARWEPALDVHWKSGGDEPSRPAPRRLRAA